MVTRRQSILDRVLCESPEGDLNVQGERSGSDLDTCNGRGVTELASWMNEGGIHGGKKMEE